MNYTPIQTTPFSKWIKVKSRIWRLVWMLFFRPSPWFMYRYRAALVNMFGGNISYKAKIANSSFIDFPWNLTMKDFSSAGENSWIYCLEKIVIEQYSCIGQFSKLITGSHDYKSLNFELIMAPIVINEGCWITNDVTILHGVTIGKYSVIGAKSLVTKDIPPNVVAFGVPCKAINNRFEI